MNWNYTKQLIPNGVQTESKRPDRHVDGVYPKYITRGDGAYIWGDNGEKYIDFPCGLGPIILGHNHPIINRRVIDQLGEGILYPLPSYKETELAELICDIIPSAEQVRFLKTGSEATSAAIKIARAYSNKDNVLCCGYHGWHDWYNVCTPKNAGVPKVLAKTIKQFKYNDIDDFKSKLLKKNGACDIAAVIMEPYVLEAPDKGFLETIRKLCTQHKVVLIFDEVVTAFRTPKYTAQALFKVTPDLTCLGKAMANGFPIACVCGKKEIMSVLKGNCFVSSTWGGDLVGISAAIATINFMKDHNVLNHIELMGSRLKEDFNRMSSDIEGVKCIGYPQRTFFIFPTETLKSCFWQECLKMGVFFGYAQFISFSHTLMEMDKTSEAMRHAFRMLKKYWDNPEELLTGKSATATFRLVCTEKENG